MTAPPPERRSRFTPTDLAVVVLILAILTGVLVPRVTDRLAAARDARRLADVQAVRDAIERYYMKEGRYPAPSANSGYGGWDVSHDGDFVPALVAGGYLERAPSDPIDDDDHHYRYYVYPRGAYGCKGGKPYYVLGIRGFETEEFRERHPGGFRCNQRDWGAEFAWVTGGGATHKE